MTKNKMRVISATAGLFGCLFLSVCVQAGLIAVDWQPGDGLVTRDDNGLEWLNLNVTRNRSYNDVSDKLDAGEEFDGWIYATSAQVRGLWNSAGGDAAHYNGWSTQNDGLFGTLWPFWGDTNCFVVGITCGDGYSHGLLSDPRTDGRHWFATAGAAEVEPEAATMDYFSLLNGSLQGDSVSTNVGSALVREAQVPEPMPFALCAMGLLGLGFTRRYRRTVAGAVSPRA